MAQAAGAGESHFDYAYRWRIVGCSKDMSQRTLVMFVSCLARPLARNVYDGGYASWRSFEERTFAGEGEERFCQFGDQRQRYLRWLTSALLNMILFLMSCMRSVYDSGIKRKFLRMAWMTRQLHLVILCRRYHGTYALWLWLWCSFEVCLNLGKHSLIATDHAAMEAIDPARRTKTATTTTGFACEEEPTGGYKHVSSIRPMTCQHWHWNSMNSFAKARSDRSWSGRDHRRIWCRCSIPWTSNKMVRTSQLTWRFNVTLVTLLGMSLELPSDDGTLTIRPKAINGGFEL